MSKIRNGDIVSSYRGRRIDDGICFWWEVVGYHGRGYIVIGRKNQLCQNVVKTGLKVIAVSCVSGTDGAISIASRSVDKYNPGLVIS
jgi:hypothetical protein